VSTPLKIALIRQKYNAAGGAERFVSRAIEALVGQGAEVTLLTRRWEHVAGMQPIQVAPFYLGNVWRDAGFSCAVRAELAKRRFDLVQSHERIAGCDVYRAGDGVHSEWLARRRRILSPLGRLSLALNPYHHYMRRAERRMFLDPGLKAVICISEMVKQDILRHFPIDPAKLFVIYNGIDTERFHPRLRDQYRAATRRELGIAPDRLALLFVGSGFERKGLAVLLAALAASGSDAELIVVGKDKHAARYQAQAERLGLGARVHFLGAQDDPRPYYAAADAFVFPTLYEPFGNVHLEALAMGLPILTSSGAGAAELVRPGENGYVCDPLDPAGLAAILRQLSRERCAAMGAEARRTAEGFRLDAMGARLIEFYRSLLSNENA